MMKYIPALSLTAALPLTTKAKTLQEIVDGTIVPLGNTIIGVLYAFAFIFFLIGMARLFFSDGEENRAKGKQFAMWGIIGLAVLAATWGLVNVLLRVLTDFT